MNRFLYWLDCCGVALVLLVTLCEGTIGHVRGLIPWHNFLSGPSSWNIDDYKKYIDEANEYGFNLIALHSYQGGSERYFTYVDPLVLTSSSQYIVPSAHWDSTATARWGYYPLPVSEFAFNSSAIFGQPQNNMWGSDCATLLPGDQQYQCTISMIQEVIEYAHSKGIQVAIGFEFGVWPPALYSAFTSAVLSSPYLVDPTAEPAKRIFKRTITWVTDTYRPDYLMLWMQENPVLYANMQEQGWSTSFTDFYEKSYGNFSYLEGDSQNIFNGVWCLAHMLQAPEFTSSEVPLVLSGWGGDSQLTPLLQGLHTALPKDIIFSVLTPNMGRSDIPEILGQIQADGRPVWGMPWLESDFRLWHPQPRVALTLNSIQQASKMNLAGVVGIHWRTQGYDVSQNIFALSQALAVDTTVSEVYSQWCSTMYSTEAAATLSPYMATADIGTPLTNRIHYNHATTQCTDDLIDAWPVDSEEYYPYDPDSWGMLSIPQESWFSKLADYARGLEVTVVDPVQKANIHALGSLAYFVLALKNSSLELQVVKELREEAANGQVVDKAAQCDLAQAAIDRAQIQRVFDMYVDRVQSRGEMGVLASMNQKLWTWYTDNVEWLESYCSNLTD
ncbi:hypothetical protein Pelo_10743 [Pelomyxa schiedti]|nr:hypothetical protein Pelo_10743 [Pelomyxa schiedti]